MTQREPPDWALPAWDQTDDEPVRTPPVTGSAANRRPPQPGERTGPPGTFGLTILGVSDVTRAVREAVRSDDRLRDWRLLQVSD